jgi:tRNA G18 (ribose-2'-O)-methylase SpoU
LPSVPSVVAHLPMRIYGINPVLEALRARRVTGLRVSARADDRLNEIVRAAAAQGLPKQRVGAGELDRAAGGARHQ